MADLAATLLACQNPDPSVRVAAEQALSTAEKNNLPEFIQALATELATEGRDPNVRQLAGIHLKNLLSSKDEEVQETKSNQWKQIPAASRTPIKATIISTIASQLPIARHTGAQTAAAVAAIELPFGEWPEFLPTLMNYVSSATVHDGVKVSSLECLGFTSEYLADEDIDQNIINTMLTTIVDGLNKDRAAEVQLSAAHALNHSTVFIKGNMENATERDMIMGTICQTTQSADVQVRTAAFECIVSIAYNYYEKLEPYMQSLYQLTLTAIQKDEDRVALQAIEFWSTICEEEIDLNLEAEEAIDRQVPVVRKSVNYVKQALQFLGEVLTYTLTKQDEDLSEDDNWNVSMAGATCLSLVANTVGDAVVPVIIPFVEKNILNQENWRLREAATTAFSMILEGPSPEAIGSYVNSIIPVLLKALTDQHPMVIDSSAWALGKICELHVRSIPSETFPTLVTGLTSILFNENAQVAAQGCFAIHNLAAAFQIDPTAATAGTNAMSPYMPELLQTLLNVSDREDSNENNLKSSAVEAISMLIQQSAPDCRPLLTQFLPPIVERLAKSINYPVVTNEDRENKESLQSNLCSIIQVTEQKLTKEDVVGYADVIMQNLIQVLHAKKATAHAEAFLAIGALADLMEADFEKYMPALHNYIMMGLQNFEAYQVCTVAVGVVVDLSRALGAKIQPYCNDIMGALIASLQNQALHRSVKPPLISCFSDIALAIEAAYEPYLQASLVMMMQASQTRAPDNDEDLIEYINLLREAILEAYSGIIQGLKYGGRIQILVQYLEPMSQFLETIVAEAQYDLSVLGKAIGLVGDMASCFGPPAAPFLKKEFVSKLLQEGESSYSDNIMHTTLWAKQSVMAITATA